MYVHVKSVSTISKAYLQRSCDGRVSSISIASVPLGNAFSLACGKMDESEAAWWQISTSSSNWAQGRRRQRQMRAGTPKKMKKRRRSTATLLRSRRECEWTDASWSACCKVRHPRHLVWKCSALNHYLRTFVAGDERNETAEAFFERVRCGFCSATHASELVAAIAAVVIRNCMGGHGWCFVVRVVQVMRQTETTINWPSKLKIGAKSKKGETSRIALCLDWNSLATKHVVYMLKSLVGGF